ncbi:DUF6380 family protein [Streptomyces sp. NPDC052415]
MDCAVRGDGTGEKWQATLRGAAASLTETADRARFRHRGGRSGEGTR